MLAEGVLRRLGVEFVGREVVLAADELEALGRDNQVQNSLLDADRAIAIDHRKIGRDTEAHATAVAPAFHGQHGMIAFNIIRARVRLSL
jgi:hypothetical protein